jgi:hypothetical protein
MVLKSNGLFQVATFSLICVNLFTLAQSGQVYNAMLNRLKNFKQN